jgi:hypothetical protein
MTEQTCTPAPEATSGPALTKASNVEKLLSRSKGATLAEMTNVTAWQPHSTRAFLTGLRKKGKKIVREARPSDKTSWRIKA